MRQFLVARIMSAGMFLIATAVSGAAAFAQTTKDVVGTWMLVSSVTEKEGIRTHQFGRGATGMLSLDANGHFMLTIIGPDLPRFASNSRAAGTAEENATVVAKSIAMTGAYSVSSSDNTLLFNVENSTFPNWNGTSQRRTIVSLDGDELKYITAVASSGGVATVTWKRLK